MGTTNQEPVSSALLQAIQTMAQGAANATDRTLTVEAKITDVNDAGKGIYEVQYLGNTFEAATANNEIVYDIDDIVYVIVPNGNFDKNKIILSPVYSKAITYSSEQENSLYINGNKNLFNFNSKSIELHSYLNEQVNVLEQYDLDNFYDTFNYALKESRIFNLQCKIRTNIDMVRRSQGNYGLMLSIPVLQEKKETFYIVTLDINNIKGNAYNLAVDASQNLHFEFPADMELDPNRELTFIGFVNNFPGSRDTIEPTPPADIWISDIQLLSSIVVEEQNKIGYYLYIEPSNGPLFLNDGIESKTLTPTLYLKGRTTNINNFACYWFKENYLITAASQDYNKFGGLGWEILNEKTNTEISEDGYESYQYVTNIYPLEIFRNEIGSSLRYKCVLVKDNTTISQIIEISDLTSINDKIEIVSATGSNIYTENVGRVRLIVKYYGEIGEDDFLNYAWQRFDKNGNYIDNDFYTIDRVNEKKESWYESEFSFDVSKIDKKNILYCTAYKNINGFQKVIDTESIAISTQETETYTIKIDNGDKIYKYDADGDSPMVADYDGPISSVIKNILPLTITLFKPDGKEFTADDYAVTELEWLVPINSLINLGTQDNPDTTSNPGYYTIHGAYNELKNLSYKIANSYNKRKTDGVVFVRAYYKDIEIESSTNLRFLKDGESGTNGSKYSAIVTYQGYGYGEKAENGKDAKLQLIYVENEDKWYYYDFINNTVEDFTSDSCQFFIDLYCDGEKITISNVDKIQWKIFDKDYDYDNIISPIDITNNGYIFVLDNFEWHLGNTYCATVEVKCPTNASSITNSEEYVYAYYPIEFTYVKAKSILDGVIPTLAGGFDDVVYASDGTNPKYDSGEDFQFYDNRYNENGEEFDTHLWETSPNLKQLSSAVDTTCKVIPVTKFDNGAAKNFVKVSLQISPSRVAELVREKERILEPQQEELAKKITYYNELVPAIEGAFANYHYDEWVNEIRIFETLYKTKTSLIDFCKKTIKDLKAIKKKYHQNYNELINRWTTLLTLVKKVGMEYGIVEQIKPTYSPESFKLDTSSITNKSLKEKIEKYNNQIDTVYSVYYESLSPTNSKDLADIIIKVKNFVNDGNWGTLIKKGEQQYLFKGLNKNLVEYVKKLDKKSSNYSTIVEKVLNPINDLVVGMGDLNRFAAIKEELVAEKESLDNKIVECNTKIAIGSESAIVHTKPIIMLFNRYEMSNLNGWDGNKLVISENEGYILSPQVGAGKKEEDNSFTGIVMGVKQLGVKNTLNQKIGLFGYGKGIETLFLNAQDGSASFGASGSGQILIKPGSEGNVNATITGGNYIEGTSGLLIDLTAPEIKFGSGNFKVNSEGHITAKGGGTIGGWQIGDTTLYSIISPSKSYGKVILDSEGSIYVGKNSETDKKYWTITEKEVTQVDQTIQRLAYIAYGTDSSYIETDENNQVKIQDGAKNGEIYMGTDGFRIGKNFGADMSGNLFLKGKIQATSGLIGNWEISNGKIVGKKSNNQRIELNAEGAIACKEYDSQGTVVSTPWSISRTGNATFNNITATGTINAKGGYIGNNSNAVSKGGFSFGAGSVNIGGFNLNSGGAVLTAEKTKVGDKGLKTYIEDLAVGTLTADRITAKFAEVNSSSFGYMNAYHYAIQMNSTARIPLSLISVKADDGSTCYCLGTTSTP